MWRGQCLAAGAVHRLAGMEAVLGHGLGVERRSRSRCATRRCASPPSAPAPRRGAARRRPSRGAAARAAAESGAPAAAARTPRAPRRPSASSQSASCGALLHRAARGTSSMTSLTPVSTTATSAGGGACGAQQREAPAAWSGRSARAAPSAPAAPMCRCSARLRWPASAWSWWATPTPAADESPAISSRSAPSPCPTRPCARPGGLGQHRRALARAHRLRHQHRREHQLQRERHGAARAAQNFEKSGLRFWKKAWKASIASGLRSRAANSSPSAADGLRGWLRPAARAAASSPRARRPAAGC